MSNQETEDFIVKLIDDENNEVEYVLMDSIELEEHTYVYLVPKDQINLEEQELYIMEYVENGDEIVFNSIDNEVLLDELYDEYMNLDDNEDDDNE